MNSTTEDELLDALTWSEDSYTLSEFVTEFPLPQVVKVVRGHDGGADSSTLGYGEVLTIHALRETRVLAAQDQNGNAISVGLDFPDEFQILPQVKDCSVNSCGVMDLVSIYQTVKYLEVIQAHYGTGDNIDTVDVGEILEILDIHKPNKPDKCKVHVLDLHSNQKSILTSSCSARFRPLLDWRKYKAPELKTHQFGLPVRVRFMDTEIAEDTEFQRLMAKSPDINVVNETDDVMVITTTVSSDPDFKFAFEIPKDLEIKVAVAEGFSNGARHYTDIVTNLNERFNVTKFMTSHQAALIQRRDVLKQHDYDSIKDYIIDKSIPPVFNEAEPETPGPPLPPRKSQSFDIPPPPPPEVPERPKSRRKNSAPDVETTSPKPKPPVVRRPRSVSQNQSDVVHTPPLKRNNFHVQQSTSIDPNDPSPSEANDDKDGNAAVNNPTSPVVPQRTENHASEKKNKPSPPPKTFVKNLPSTNGSPTPPSVANNPLQAELKEIMAKKRQVKPLPRTPMKKDENSEHPQTSNVSKTSKETCATSKEKEISHNKGVESPVKVPESTDSPVDAQTTIDQPPSQTDEMFPKLPPRRQQEIPEDHPSNPEGNSLDKIPERDDQTEEKAPKLPPKSPARLRRYNFNDGPNYVQPIQPGYSAPYTPPPHRAPLTRSNRPGTLPKDYRFRGVQQEQDDVYAVPYDPPVVPVAPYEVDKTRPQSSYEPSRHEVDIASIPLDLSGLGITDVSDILNSLNMPQYAKTFENELIDGSLLKELKESELADLQMVPLHRTKLLNFIKGWRPNRT